MTAAQLPPDDDPSRSPRLLAPLPKRGRGVRRLNKIPVAVVVAGICLVVGAIGYTYRARLQSSAAALRDADAKAEAASGAAVLNGAPRSGEIRSAVFRPIMDPPIALPPASIEMRRGPTDGGQQSHAAEDDPALQARKQAWQTYYQQLAALAQSRQQDALNAMKAATEPTGFTAANVNGPRTGAGSGAEGISRTHGIAEPTDGVTPAVYAGTTGLPFGSGGFAANYPVLPPATSDTAGAREKQAFTGQAGDLGQNDTLPATVRDPISPYLITAGDVIPCVAQSGEDSDTPGQFVGRVSRNVHDSATGRFLLIPQNAKVIGSYDNVVTNGQTRIPTVITRIIFPDSSSIPIGAMPAADQGGFAGLHDQVDRHLWEKFGNALILAIGSAAVQLSQGTGQNAQGYNAQQIGAAAFGQQFAELGQEYARAGLAIPNTLRIRNGYNFVVQVTKDIVLRPYTDLREAGSGVVGSRPVLQ